MINYFYQTLDGETQKNMTVNVCDASNVGQYECCPPAGDCKSVNVTGQW